MSTKESPDPPDRDEESGDAAPGSWRMSWSVMAARWAAVRISSLFVSILERSLTISPRDRLKPHAAYLIIAVSKSSSYPLPAARLRVGHAHRHLGSVAVTQWLYAGILHPKGGKNWQKDKQ